MAKIMNLLSTLFHPGQRKADSLEKVRRIQQLSHETREEAAKLREHVEELSQADDPLAELMRTLRPKRRRSRSRGDA